MPAVVALQARSGRLVDVETSDVPEGVFEGRGVGVDVVNAALRACTGVRGTGPVTAESQVNDDVLRLEAVCNVAVVVGEVGVRLAPCTRVNDGLAIEVLEINGDVGLVSAEEPDVDHGCGTFHSEEAAADGIEVGAIRVGTVRVDHAPGAGTFRRRAVGADDRSPEVHVRGIYAALRAGVENGTVRSFIVHTLENVDLATVRPSSVVSVSPECRPGAATSRHMAEIQNHDTVPIRLVAGDTNRVASRAVGVKHSGVVGAHNESIVRRKSQVLFDRSALVDVVDAAMSRIGEVLMLETIEELVADEGLG